MEDFKLLKGKTIEYVNVLANIMEITFADGSTLKLSAESSEDDTWIDWKLSRSYPSKK